MLVDCNQHFSDLTGILPNDLNEWSMFGLIRPDELQETYGWVAEVLHRREERQHTAKTDEKKGGTSINNNMHGDSAEYFFEGPSSSFSSSPLSRTCMELRGSITNVLNEVPGRSKALSLNYIPNFGEAVTHPLSSSHMYNCCERQGSVINDTGSRPISPTRHVLVQKAVSLPCVGHERISKDGSTNHGRGPVVWQEPKADSFMSISFVRDHDLCPIYFHLALHKSRNETCG